MDEFESTFQPNQIDECTKSAQNSMDRLKIGEVFQVRHNHYVFICIHCSKEFENFVQFTGHVQSHFQAAFQWVNSKNTEPSNTSAVGSTMEHVEWLASESGDDESDYNPDASEMLADTIDTSMENNASTDNVIENEESQSIKSRFGIRNPLIDVEDVEESRSLLPYFAKDYTFDKTVNQQLKCPMCEYMSMFKSSLRGHILTHAKTNIFTCKICLFKCNRPQNVQEHIEQKHREISATPHKSLNEFERKFKIERLNPQGNLNETNIIVSEKVKIEPGLIASLDGSDQKSRLQCHICHKAFSKANGIVKHMKVHAQERNHQCFVCGQRFIRSDHLNRHKLCHSEPSFRCDICQMAFRRSDKLLTHRRKHSEPMNFTCENCGLGFMEIASVKTHIGFHCKGKPTNIEETTTTALSITNQTDELGHPQTSNDDVMIEQANLMEPIIEMSEEHTTQQLS